jgi:sugar lactone lactonase YvrE
MGTQSTINLSFCHVSLRILLFLFSLAVPLSRAAQAPAQTIPLLLPMAVGFDSVGNLYIAETANHIIRKLDTVGQITIVAGTGAQGFSGDAGPAVAATLDSPQGLAIDANNNLYIADTHNQRIRKLNLATGNILTIAGTTPGFSGDGGLAISAQLLQPTAIALDSKGNVYLADSGNHRIRRIEASTGIITTIAGAGTQGFSGDNASADQASIDSPAGLAVDLANNIYIADTHNQRIRRIDASTGMITTIAGTGIMGFSGDVIAATSATLALPRGLTVDASGNLYLADSANHRIRRIDTSTGIISTVVGNGVQSFSGDGAPAISASLDTPGSAVFSPGALLTVADTGNQRIRQLTAAPATNTNIQTVAGFSVAQPTTLTLAAPSTLVYGTGQLTATLSSAISTSGNVTFFDGNGSIGNVALTMNTATLAINTLAAGSHIFSASYPGDQTHLSAQSSPVMINITRAPTIITLTNSTKSSDSSIILTAHVVSTTIGSPTGSVSLLDSANTLFTAQLSTAGDAVFNVTAPTQGLHSFTALFNGSTNFAASTSSPQLITVPPGTSTNPDFTLAPAGLTTQTISSGDSATFNFSVQFQGAISSPVTLAATGLPNFATVSFSPPILPPGSATSSFAMTITTPNATALEVSSKASIKWALLLSPFVLLAFRRRSTPAKLLTAALVSVTLCCASGCGDRVNTTNASLAPPKSYLITITGTATTVSGGILQHAAMVTLLLQQAQ